jgi:hypothetical protein
VLRFGVPFAEIRVVSAASAEDAERARTSATATEVAARDAAQAAAREKTTLDAKVSELERDLVMATTDLVTAGR